MPKNAKTSEAHFAKQHQDLDKSISKHLLAVQENVRILRAKKTELLKRKASLIKHTQVRKVFLKLNKPVDLEKVVSAINDATTLTEGADLGSAENKDNRGQLWEAQYSANLLELCRLVDEALTNIKRLLLKKEEEEKKLVDIQRKLKEFHDSVLERLQELKSERQKPFQISSTDNVGNDYLYSKTPFQIYAKK